MLLYGAKKDILPWASKQLFGTENDFNEADEAIGITKDGNLIGVVVYTDYRPNLSIEMSIATVDKNWASRYNLRAFFEFPFTQLRLRRVQTLCSANNEGVIMFNKKLGFKPEGYHRCAWHDGGDAISWSMLKEECRWL